jgi:chaperonin cofactor prefoldin
MSGCFPTETLSICIHGNPVKFGRCLICDPMTKAVSLDNLSNEIASLKNRIETLHTHKLRQIDENNKAFKWLKSHEEKINDLCGYVKHLCELTQSLQERIEVLESGFSTFRSELNKKVDAIFDNFNETISKSSSKKPYLCPVCSGNGKHKVFLSTGICVCACCDGKGIIWG